MPKYYLIFLSLFSLFFVSCQTPNLYGKEVKKEYFTGGQVRSEFIMDDDTEQNGFLKNYGYSGELLSTVHIRNGVKDGVEIGYDIKKRVMWKYLYVNGKQHGVSKAFYPNGDTMISYTYKNGLRDGWAYTYRKDGLVDRKVFYVRGKIAN